MSNHDTAPKSGAAAYRMAYGPGDNPFLSGTADFREWDRDFWDEHDASVDFAQTGGIEEGYGDFYDTDAVSQGMYDDDPSPYDGNYSEM